MLIFAGKSSLMLMSEEKRAKIIAMIRDTIREAEPSAQIILYGSRARGDAREDSDWDVLVIVDKEKTNLADFSRLCYPIYYKGLDYGEEINPTLYTQAESDAQQRMSVYKSVGELMK